MRSRPCGRAVESACRRGCTPITCPPEGMPAGCGVRSARSRRWRCSTAGASHVAAPAQAPEIRRSRARPASVHPISAGRRRRTTPISAHPAVRASAHSRRHSLPAAAKGSAAISASSTPAREVPTATATATAPVEPSSAAPAMKPSSAAPVAASTPSALRRRGDRQASECQSCNSAKDFRYGGFLHGRSLQPATTGSQESILEVSFDRRSYFI